MIDLHLHSTRSDGLADPDRVRERIAACADLRLVALTDHDMLAASARLAAEEPRAVAGVELNARGGRGTLHLLALGVDPDDERLIGHLAARTAERVVRFRTWARLLTGLGLTFDAEPWVADPEQHQATKADAVRELLAHEENAPVLRRLGADPADPGSVYPLLGSGGVADVAPHVADTLPAPDAAIALIHAAGGLAVIAHPVFVPFEGTPVRRAWSLLARFVAMGADGIECFHPDVLAHPLFGEILDFTLARGLLVGVGSDDHTADLERLGSVLDPADPRAETLLRRWEEALGRR